MSIVSVNTLSERKAIVDLRVARHVSNALKRNFSHLETLAIHIVNFYHNGSIEINDMIAHRLGLVVILSHEGVRALRRNCPCAHHCEDCSFKCHLDVTNTGKELLKVTAQDIKFDLPEKFKNVKIRVLDDRKVYDPIVWLPEGKRLKVECLALIGTGYEHAKWRTTINPSSVLTNEALAYNQDLPLHAKYAQDMMGGRFKRQEMKDMTGWCRIKFETNGALTCTQALSEACDILVRDVDEALLSLKGCYEFPK